MRKATSIAARTLLAGLAACSPAAPDADAMDPAQPESSAAATTPREQVLLIADAKVAVTDSGPPQADAFLLLHGARFTRRSWRETQTYARLTAAGYRVVGIDLPGYGDSDQTELLAVSFLEQLCDTLELRRPILVTPSMSGGYGLPFVVERPTRLAGYVALAPVQIPRWLDQWPEEAPPVLAIWGDQDRVVPRAHGEQLAEVAGAELHVLANAGHPSYLDQPDAFHELLIEFAARCF